MIPSDDKSPALDGGAGKKPTEADKDYDSSSETSSGLVGNNGWVCLHRRLLEHPRFQDGDWLKIWIYLLMEATHKERRAIFNGKTITLKAGQLITGRYKIARNTGVNSASVYRILQTLKIEHQIEQQTSNKSSLITLKNWTIYQSTEHLIEHLSSSKRAASEHSTTMGTMKTMKTPKGVSVPSHSKSTDSANVYVATKKLEALDSEIKVVSARGWEDSMGLHLKPEDKKRIRDLKQKRYEINRQLIDC